MHVIPKLFSLFNIDMLKKQTKNNFFLYVVVITHFLHSIFEEFLGGGGEILKLQIDWCIMLIG